MRRRSRMTPARKLACVLLAVAVVVSVVYATGAFTTTTAERDVDIEVAGDGSAFLSLQPSEGPNGDFASYGPMGALQVKIGGAGLRSPATGVNPDSKTVFKNVFTITNNGSQPVAIWITGHSKAVTFRAKSAGVLIEGQGNSRPLSVGETLHIGFVIDTRGGGVQPGTNLLKSVTIHTNANNKVVSKARKNAKKSGGGGSTGSGTGGSGSGNGNGGTQAGNGGGGGNDGPGWPGDDESEGDSGGDGSDGDDGDGSDDDDSDAGDGDDGDESDDSSDDGIDAGRVIRGIIEGFFIGDIGMPGGFWGITAKTAETLFYFFGMMLNAIASMAVTALDIGSTLRDLVGSISQGNVIGVVLNALSLVPVLGALEGASDLVKTAQKWLDAFPSKADEVLGFLSSTILKHLPDSIGGKLLGLVSDAPVSKLVDEGIPVEDIVKYSDEVDFQKVLELRSQGVSPADIRYYVENDIDLGLVSKLRTKNIPASTIRRYADEGIDLNKVKRLRSKGLSPRATKYAVLKGADSQTIFKLQSQGIPTRKILQYFDEGADLKAVSKLLSQDVPASKISDFVDEGADLGKVNKLLSQDVPVSKVSDLVDEGADLGKVNKLLSQNTPMDDITWYVENSISLTGVSKLQDMGLSPRSTKKLLKAAKWLDKKDKYERMSEREILTVLNRKVVSIGGTQRYTLRALEIAKAALAYKSVQEAKQKQDSQTRTQNRSAGQSFRHRDEINFPEQPIPASDE